MLKHDIPVFNHPFRAVAKELWKGLVACTA
jgi:hypothetical protein